MRFVQITLTIILFISLMSGCSSTPIKFPAITATEVDVANSREIHGKACGFQLLLLIPININGRYEDAYEQLIQAAGREQIANVRIEESWFYGFVGTGYCTKLMATAYPKNQVTQEKQSVGAKLEK